MAFPPGCPAGLRFREPSMATDNIPPWPGSCTGGIVCYAMTSVLLSFLIGPHFFQAMLISQPHSPATPPAGFEKPAGPACFLHMRFAKTRKPILPNLFEWTCPDISFRERAVICNLTTQHLSVRHNSAIRKSGPAEKRI